MTEYTLPFTALQIRNLLASIPNKLTQETLIPILDEYIETQGIGSTDKPYADLALNINNNTFIVDYNNSNNAVINLISSLPNITYLDIINVPVNQSGKILIKQSGNKILIPTSSIIQELVLPTQQNKITVIYYSNIAGTIYLTQDIVISDIFYQGPKVIDSLSVNSFDGIIVDIKWIEPYSDSPDGLPIDGYDIRYSNSPITTSVGWLNAIKLNVQPVLVGGGKENSLSIKLKAGTNYYIYFKTFKNYRGSYYLSPISNVIQLTTKTYLESVIGEPKMLPLSMNTSYPKLNKYQVVNGVLQDTRFLFDKTYTPRSINDERPNTSVKLLGSTYWEPQKYWEDSLPYYAVFDLGSICTLDSVYMFVPLRANLIIYASKSQFEPWVEVGNLSVFYNDWGNVSFSSLEDKDYRYIKVAWEQQYYASSNTEVEGTHCWSISKETEFNTDTYSFLGVYGYPKSRKPTTIIEAVRDYSKKHTIGDVMCSNGHFYQDGRIHSMVSGKYVRLFGNLGHFDANTSLQDKYNTIEEFKYKTEQLPWVSNNCSDSSYTLRTLLEKTYKPFGLKPFIVGTGTFDSVQRKSYTTDTLGNKTYTNLGDKCKLIDQNWFERDNPPSPIKGINGVQALFDYTFNPINYKIYAKLAYTLAAKYGSKKLTTLEESNLPIEIEGLSQEMKISGLDLLSGFEYANEQNRTWDGWETYQQAEEAGAMLTTIYDGNLNKISGVLGGVKKADPNFLVLNAGIVGIDKNYLYHQDVHAKKARQDNSIPLDIYSVHMYSSTLGTDQTTQSTFNRGLPWDMQPELQRYATDVSTYRNRFAPTKQIWVTEFGYGEAGGYNTDSSYAAYSLPGYVQGEYTIPDIHRSEIKASWTIRNIIQGLIWGFNSFQYYSTECESNWFGIGQWDAGAGYEMFEWDKLTDNTPGAKVDAERTYMIPYTRGGFSSMGLFGSLLGNGAYPISRATWIYMTFRNRLKDYYFTGTKKIINKEDLIIACFAHKTEAKSAFVIYRIGNTNSCYTDIEVSLPDSIQELKKINYYIPKLTDPRSVPYSKSFGLDSNRTGLKTSTREYDINGKVINATFPTTLENPYFPIVGPISSYGVMAKYSGSTELGWKVVSASQYITEVGENLEISNSTPLSYRQINAVCDYIDFHPEGIKGAHGTEENVMYNQGSTKIDVVTEIPTIYMIDGAIIESDFESSISDLSGVSTSSTSVTLYWNNSNPKDEYCDLYLSEYPEGGYSLNTSIKIGLVNEYLLTGLRPGTTYYVKLQPKYKDKLGTLSNYTPIKTFDYVPVPQNLIVTGTSINSIRLSFDSEYTTIVTNSFLNYTIERKDIDGTTTTFKIANKAINYLDDTNLPIGTNYSYRVKVSTYGGDSEWSSFVINRTLTPEEANPVLLSVESDKIINIIKLKFDIDLSSTFNRSVVNAFTLLENGNNRVLTSVALDTNNPKILILTYYPGILSTFDKDLPLLLSYTKPIDNLLQIKSIYNNSINSFSNIKVKNNFGNYNNLINTYQVNFDKEGSTTNIDGWNSIIPLGISLTRTILNKYGLSNNVTLEIPYGEEVINSVVYRSGFSPNSNTDGKYTSTKFTVPAAIYSTYGTCLYHATNARLYYSIFKIKGLISTNRYTLNLFSSKLMTGTNSSYLSFNVNGVSSGLLNFVNNTDKYITYSDISPINGEIIIKLYCESTDLGKNVPLNFFILEEFKDSTQEDDGTVFIKDVYILNKEA